MLFFLSHYKCSSNFSAMRAYHNLSYTSSYISLKLSNQHHSSRLLSNRTAFSALMMVTLRCQMCCQYFVPSLPNESWFSLFFNPTPIHETNWCSCSFNYGICQLQSFSTRNWLAECGSAIIDARKCPSMPDIGEVVPHCVTFNFRLTLFLLNAVSICISLLSRLYLAHTFCVTLLKASRGTRHLV
jgi:hypothetical protein